MATLQDQFAARKQESAGRIGSLYDQQYQSQAAQLKGTYDQSMSAAQAEQGKIAPQYQQQANALAAQYERSRRNANVNAMANGLGTGTAVQQQNALNTQFQNNYAGLRGNEAAAQSQAAQNMADIRKSYENQLASARATSENAKASALVEDQNKQQQWYEQQAQLLAGYGDFSAYEQLYGAERAAEMKKIWAYQNPDVAWATGALTKKQYKKITGRDPGER